MKVAWWLGIGTVLIVVLLVATKGGEQRRGDFPQDSSERLPQATSNPDALGPGSGMTDSVRDTGNATMATTVPVWALEEGSTNITEAPPRTIFGIEPVMQSTELPIVDPATLPFDKNVGRIVVVGAGRAGDNGSGGASHPMSPQNDQPIETNDGPLGGLIPRPDPSVPGPAIQTLSTAEPGEVRDPAVMDPFGPGQPIDPEAAAVTVPNFVLPGPDGTVESPDLSPEASNSDDSN